MQKTKRMFSGILLLVFIFSVTVLTLPYANAAEDTSWEASLAFGKKVTFMQGTVNSNGTREGLVDGNVSDSKGKYMRLNSNGIGADRWSWFQVDLDDEQEVNYFKVFTHKLYNASKDSYITTIRIEGSEDGELFEEIIPNTSPANGGAFPHNTMIDFASPFKVQARYIRIWLQIADQEGDQAFVPALREFGVYCVENPTVTYQQPSGQSGTESTPSTPSQPSSAPVLNDSYTGVASDVIGTKYEIAVDRLMALNIMAGYKDGTFKPDNTINRAEFASIICKVLGLSELGAVKQNTSFNDVSSSHWASGYIKVAADTKIINGYGDGRFGPDDPVTYEQVIKMLVSVLGYEIQAVQRGGYPSGYVIVASQLGLYKNINDSLSENAKRGVIAQMLYNAISVDIMEQTGFGTEIKYTVTTGKTLLTKMLETYRKSGQVTATGSTTLVGNSSLREDEVRIDNVVFKVGNTNAKDYLGYHVNYYFREDTALEEYILTYIQVDANRNQVLTVNAEDINKDGTSVEKFTYYDENGRSVVANIHVSPYVIFNGKASNTFDEDDLKPLSGIVKLLDTNNDGIYDLVYITSYDIYLVDSINATEYKVYDKLNNDPLELNTSDKKLDITIIKDGKNIRLSDIKQWDVLSVAKSRDNMVIHVTVTSVQVKGKVQEVSMKSEDKIDNVMINDKAYEVSYYFNGNINVDDEGTFYLDIYGKIVAVDTTSTMAGQYGYLVKIARPIGLGGNVQLKVLSTNGKWNVFESESKISVTTGNQTVRIDVINLFNNTNLFNDNGDLIYQLIKYKLNSEGKLTDLFISVDNVDKTIEYGTEIFTCDRKNLVGRYSTNYLTRNVKISSKAVVFVTPSYENEDLIPYNQLEDEKFGVYSASGFFVNNKDYTDTSLKIMVYDFDELYEARVLVVHQQKEFVANLTTITLPAVIERVAQGINEEGDPVIRFYVLENGIKKSITADKNTIRTNMNVPSPFSSVKITDLKKGDVIQYVETNGLMANYRVLYQAENKTERLIFRGTGGASSTAADLEVVYGTFYIRLDNRIGVRFGNEVLYYELGSEVVYMYDSKADNIAIAGIGDAISVKQDVERASKIFIQSRRNSARTIVIYK